MAKTFKRSSRAVSMEADRVCALLDGGFLDLYDGAQPATPDIAITTQTRIARLTFSAPAYAAAVNGVAQAHAIISDLSAAATGTVAWFRAVAPDGSAIFDGSIGLSASDINLNDVLIQQGAEVSISTLPYTANKG